MHSLAGLDAISIFLTWLLWIAAAAAVLGGLLGIAMARSIVKRPSSIEQGIGCVFGVVAVVIITATCLLFYFYSGLL